jgi:hypothetical protein
MKMNWFVQPHGRMNALEERFHQICKREKKDKHMMMSLIQQNTSIQKEIKVSSVCFFICRGSKSTYSSILSAHSLVFFYEQELQAADELHSLLAAIMKADRDQNSLISEKELDELMLRMKISAGSSKTESKFDEASIRAAFKSVMTEQGASLLRMHSAIQKQRQEMEVQKDIDGSKYNPIVVDDDLESNLVRPVMSQEAMKQASQGGCCY